MFQVSLIVCNFVYANCPDLFVDKYQRFRCIGVVMRRTVEQHGWACLPLYPEGQSELRLAGVGSSPRLLPNIGPQIVRVCYMFRCPDGSLTSIVYSLGVTVHN